ncbi:disintegrin and metalloproteinase domain-containing protein 10 [Rhipicephalus sanguineus]|uniref:disintegrin and metalloproteinase domain-containing protein 10 n=1 Tax=Rhipicephalus sanguineus TaxID=34632 RepID=UPI0020C40576|nr:disintegrin and metalloproteinase domain-containing protein 10 [Rhipicephalus sanguineus]
MPCWRLSVLLLMLCSFSQTAVAARRLNRFVRHFEPLSYEPRTVHRGHVRVRRSLGGSQPQQQQQQQQNRHVYVRFQGFNRQGSKCSFTAQNWNIHSVILVVHLDQFKLFHLKLRPDTTVFDKDLVVETTKFGIVKPNIDHIYSGQVVGDPSSRVYGGLHNGVFEGSIQSRWGRFYVEGAHKFFARRTPFHSVMYAAEDAGIPHKGWCGVNSETTRWMQQLAVASERARKPESKSHSSRAKRHGSDHLEHWIGRRPLEQQEQPEDFYYDVDVDGKQAGKDGTDRRRAKGASRPRRTYRVCGLYVQIDHLLYRHFAQIDNDAVRTRERLSTLIAGHTARASDIYRHTDFYGVEDVRFSVHKIKINDTSNCPSKKNPFCLDKMDPTLFLLTTAKSANFDEYCLAYTWTYRDFESGVLGLAYVGNSTKESGPLCGNGIVEAAEQCDCGYTEADCLEPCCYARRNSVNAPGCTLKPGKQCSPTAGPCCDKDCKLMPTTTVCSPETECREKALCTSNNASCPVGKPKGNNTVCHKGSQVCISGECAGSVCLKYGLKGCTLVGSQYNLDQKCLVACKGEDGKCREACEHPKMKAYCGVKMVPGAVCDGTRGYCDVFQKCRRSDEQGPLTRLEQALFGGKTYNTVTGYIAAHPFLSVVYFLIFVAFMVLFFRCFSVHTPSNNPHKPSRKFRETLRNPKSFFMKP